MKLRTLTSALLIAGVSAGAQAGVYGGGIQLPLFTNALELEERYAYSLIESMLSLAAMNFEHTGKCSGDYNANVTVSQNAGLAIANIDDVDLTAFDAGGPADVTKGTKIAVFSADPGELGDVEVSGLAVYSAYDFYGTMMVADGVANLDGDLFDEHIIKDFWEVEAFPTNNQNGEDPPEELGHSKVMDYGYELITKFGYPRAKWNQHSYLWRSNGGNGYILIEKDLIAPDPINNGCTIRYSALVGNLGAGFQTIGGELELVLPALPN